MQETIGPLFRLDDFQIYVSERYAVCYWNMINRTHIYNINPNMLNDKTSIAAAFDGYKCFEDDDEIEKILILV